VFCLVIKSEFNWLFGEFSKFIAFLAYSQQVKAETGSDFEIPSSINLGVFCEGFSITSQIQDLYS
jgi:hypothetical protein